MPAPRASLSLVPRPVATGPGDLQQVLDRMSDGFVTLDREWRYTFVNRAAERHLGRLAETMLGRVLWDLFPTVVGTPLEREYRRAAAGAEPVEVEMRSPVTGRWVSHRLYPSSRGLAVYFRDVTEQREREEALREAEARWRSIFENALEALLFTKPSGEILAANRAAERLLGRTSDEICRIGREAVVDTTDPRLAQLIADRARDGHARGRVRLRRGDGTTFEGEISSGLFRDAHGEERTTISLRDLSERQRSEAALQLIADAGGVLSRSLDVNETLTRLSELVVPRFADVCVVDVIRREQHLARHARSSQEPALLERVVSSGGPESSQLEPVLARVLRSGEPELIPAIDDEWLRHATSSPEQLRAVQELDAKSAILLPLLAGGSPVGVLSLARGRGRPAFDEADLVLAESIADRAALAIETAHLYGEALHANRMREEVLAVVSHDLRNPLSVIGITAERIANGADIKENLRFVQSALGRANRLIADLLLTAQLDAGTVPLELALEDPRALLAGSVALHQPIAREKGVDLRFEVDSNLPKVRVDRHRIEQVLANLLGNALKFTPRGGRIAVSARVGAPNLVVEVSDTGAGIAPTELPHLFDRFWQGARARRAGAGLGLAIAKGMIEAHGGAIEVESEVGRGTTFRFVLPLS